MTRNIERKKKRTGQNPFVWLVLIIVAAAYYLAMDNTTLVDKKTDLPVQELKSINQSIIPDKGYVYLGMESEIYGDEVFSSYALKLKSFIKQKYGADIPVVKKKSKYSDIVIKQKNALENDQFILKINKKIVVLAGGDQGLEKAISILQETIIRNSKLIGFPRLKAEYREK